MNDGSAHSVTVPPSWAREDEQEGDTRDGGEGKAETVRDAKMTGNPAKREREETIRTCTAGSSTGDATERFRKRARDSTIDISVAELGPAAARRRVDDDGDGEVCSPEGSSSAERAADDQQGQEVRAAAATSCVRSLLFLFSLSLQIRSKVLREGMCAISSGMPAVKRVPIIGDMCDSQFSCA